MSVFDAAKIIREFNTRRKNTVPAIRNRKTHFSIEDTKAIEKYLGYKIQVRSNRLTNTKGELLTEDFAEDLKLLEEAKAS